MTRKRTQPKLPEPEPELTDIEPDEVLLVAPTNEGEAIFNALKAAMEVANEDLLKAGKLPQISDVITASVALLGMMIGGIEPEERRRQVYRGIGVMLTLAIENARQTGTAVNIQPVQKGTGTMQ